ncbi:MAG: peptide deformylase [Planctomycetota bacterium]|jgi:peptide deformylase
MSKSLDFQISIYPAPVLRKPAQAMETFDSDLKETVSAMFVRMRESTGVGLAAPQVGLNQRILVLNHTGEEGDDLALVNPKILKLSGPRTEYEEGCLSFPGIYGQVTRPDRVKISAQTVDGESFEAQYEGFQGRVIQHEMDHLEGVLLIDRISPADKLRNKLAFEDLVLDYKEDLAKAAKEAAKAEAAANK